MSKPLFQQVKDHILERIDSGALKPGDQIPSENELVRDFDSSRMTINRALKELTNDGHLYNVAGVGRFVADYTTRDQLLTIRNIADEIEARHHRHQAQVITLEQKPASEQTAHRLGLETGTPVYHSVILHLENGEPIQLEDRHVNPKCAPAYLHADFSALTPHEYLMEVAPLQEAEHLVRAAMPDASTRDLLKMAANEPCLILERRTWAGGISASHACLIHPGTRYVLGDKFSPPDKRKTRLP